MDVAKVYFVGAGPGNPDLLTIRAMKVIQQADVVIYADSLVNPEVCSFAKEDARIVGSSSLTLEEISELMIASVREGKTVARLHTGDPAIYGAVFEQMALLESSGIPFEVVPGVSSVFAACAALGVELTVPDLTQTVIITRIEGRTPVPAGERLRGLAEHQASLVLFLSAALIDNVVAELSAGGYPLETPVAVAQRISWPDERILRGTLSDIAGKVKAAGINRQALIMVGEALAQDLRQRHEEYRSKLYDKDFPHGYRGVSGENS